MIPGSDRLSSARFLDTKDGGLRGALLVPARFEP